MIKTLNNKMTMLMAASTVAVMTSGQAQAGVTDLDSLTKQVGEQTGNIPTFINIICYIFGVALVALGIVKLKQHIEQPTQAPLKDGIARVAFGALLLALPFVLGLVLKTMTGQSAGGTAGGPGTINFTPSF